MRPRLLLVLCLVLMLACQVARAQTAPADLSGQRTALLEAFRLAGQGPLDAATRARIAGHPLAGWVEATALRTHVRAAQAADVRAVLARYDGQPAADWLREGWLAELVRRRDWTAFAADYRGQSSLEMRCAHLAARQVLGQVDAQWQADAKALWLTPSSLPSTCDAPIKAFANLGGLGKELRWQRLELAALAGQTGLARYLAGTLPPADATLARDYIDFIDAPHDRAKAWPKTARSAAIAAEGLARLARRAPDEAESRLAVLAPALDLDEARRGQVLYQVALWTVASYLPGAATRLAAVPASAYDERLHEWRAREAMARGDDAAALAAIAAMPAAQREDPRWTYFEARLRERQGQAAAARPLYARAAATATFHGFLAADRLRQPYALCPLEPSTDAALRARVAAQPGLVRALELFAIDRPGQALREWSALVKSLDDAERHVAIEFAQAVDWYDRAVFSIGSRDEDLRQYRLRFPLHHENTLRREARRHGLDPALIAAEIRAESAFMPGARSSADARGLMQLLPSTAATTARRIGEPWSGAGSLYDPNTNLVLGIAHLRYELDQHDGLPYLAIAAYNAGPGAAARWRRDRPGFDPDFWIETITYKETREYVARVLAFSVIYDWRLDGTAVPVCDRLLGRAVPPAARRAFTCPLDASKP